MKTKQLAIIAVFAASTSAFAQPLYEIRPNPGGGGFDVYAPRGIQAPPKDSPHSFRYGPEVFVPNTIEPGSQQRAVKAMQDAYADGVRIGNEIHRQQQADENMRQQNKLIQQRARIEGEHARIETEQYQANLEVRRQTREAELAEAKLRKELAEAKMAELKIKQAEAKARYDAEEPERRRQAQIRFEAMTAQIQKEHEEVAAKKKAAATSSDRITELPPITLSGQARK